jgi:hypothetical protein
MDYSARASSVICGGTCSSVDEPQSFVAMVSGYLRTVYPQGKRWVSRTLCMGVAVKTRHISSPTRNRTWPSEPVASHCEYVTALVADRTGTCLGHHIAGLLLSEIRQVSQRRALNLSCLSTERDVDFQTKQRVTVQTTVLIRDSSLCYSIDICW